MTRFDQMRAHYIKKIIIFCFADLLYTHQHGYDQCIFLRSDSVTVAVQYDTRSNASLCRVVAPVRSTNLKECEQIVFFSSESLEHFFTMLVCLFFKSVDKDMNTPVPLFFTANAFFPPDMSVMCEYSSMCLSIRACFV